MEIFVGYDKNSFKGGHLDLVRCAKNLEPCAGLLILVAAKSYKQEVLFKGTFQVLTSRYIPGFNIQVHSRF